MPLILGEDTALPRLRPGLVVSADGETGRGRIVKDPVSRRYYRFDELEGFILDRIDGAHSPIDIQIALAAELNEEFALEEVQDFLDTLKEKGLIDGGGPLLPVEAPALGSQVVEALALDGVVPVLPPPGSAGRPALLGPARDGAAKFEEAVGFLQEGRFQAALRAFDELLAAEPEHHQARSIRALLLQVGTQAALAEAERQRTPQRQESPLYRRLPLLSPDRFFGALAPWLRWIWTPGFLLVYSTTVLCAGYLLLARGKELFLGVPPLPGLVWGIALAFGAVLMVTLHECAHGLTLKHYGGKVPESGLLLIFFFMPAFYVDVSDAWLLEKKRHRALVGLAGPMFDLLATALGVIACRVLNPGSGRALAVTVMTVAGASVLMNLNPLIKLDGYYVLSDLSGVPNLQAASGRAFRRLWARLVRRPVDGPALPRRTAVFLAAYNLLSTLYAIGIFVFLFKLLLGLSVSAAGLWGPLVLIAGLLWLTRRMILALLRSLTGAIAHVSWRGAVTAAALAAVVTAAGLMPVTLKVGGTVNLTARNRIPIRATVAGNLAEITVRQGDRVTPGQVIANLDTRDLEAQLTMARAAVARSRSEAALLQRPPEREAVSQVRERVHAAEVEVHQLRARTSRMERLRQEGLVSAELYEQAHKDLALGEGALRAAADEARLVAKGNRPEQISAALSEVQRQEAEATEVERRIAAAVLTAPAGGTVITPDLERRRGEYLPAGSLLLELADTSSLLAETEILEAEVGDVRPDQTVQLRFVAFPDRVFGGRVEDISPVAQRDPLGRAVFRVRCQIDDPRHELRPGMTGAAKVEAGNRTLGGLIARKALRLIDPSLL